MLTIQEVGLAPQTSKVITYDVTVNDGVLDGAKLTNLAKWKELPADTTSTVTATPALTVVKEISVNGGGAWLDANTVPGPNVAKGSSVKFRFTVTNTGNVALTDLSLADSDFSTASRTVPASLNAGANFSCTIDENLNTAGQHTNTATAGGKYGTTPVSDTDDANAFVTDPGISVKKEISVNGGGAWLDANTVPGPNVAKGSSVKFRFTVTNTGNVALTDLSLADSDFSTASCTVPASLNAGANFSCTIDENLNTAGQHTNTATAGGKYGTTPVSDTDDANAFVTDPGISVKKEISVNGGGAWLDANTVPGPNVAKGSSVKFRFTVTNTGNVALTDLSLADSDFSTASCTVPASLNAGANFSCTIDENLNTAGQHTNTATAGGKYGTTPVSDTDDANAFVTDPGISVKKEISVNGGGAWLDANTVPGPNVAKGSSVKFRFTVTNTGNVALTDLSLADSDFSTASCTVPASLNAGANGRRRSR